MKSLKKAKSKKEYKFSEMLFSDRFNSNKNYKKVIQRNSITEYSGVAAINERLEMANKQIQNTKNENDKNCEFINECEALLKNVDFSLTIPPRISHQNIKEGFYKKVENFAFNYWKNLHSEKVFEKNLEIWRQFWIVCERADVIVQIVDCRNSHLFINDDILKMYANKKHVLFFNKSDLVSKDQIEILQKKYGENVYFYSAKQTFFNFKLEGKIALIGYPNVGKSSTINLILNMKKVRVSSTPGKTKYLQTIETDKFTLLDCPGLVFPCHTKIELILMGVLNVDQITDLMKYENEIVKIVGADRIKHFYKLKNLTVNPLEYLSFEKGWQKSRCLKQIVKDFMLGEMK
ncbi:lsg1 [Nucleospora cyclopteri]